MTASWQTFSTETDKKNDSGQQQEVKQTSSPRRALPFVEELRSYINEESGGFCYPLQHVGVYNVSRSLVGQYNLNLHGYIIHGGVIPVIHVPTSCLPRQAFELKKQFSQTIFYGWAPMHASFHVSPDLVANVLASKNFDDSTKKNLPEMENARYETVGHFFRDLLSRKGVASEVIPILSAEEPYHKSIKAIDHRTTELRQSLQLIKEKLRNLSALENTETVAASVRKLSELQKEQQIDLEILEKREFVPILWELHELIRLNETVNTVQGNIFQMDPQSSFCVADRKAFECDKLDVIPYPNISVTYLFEFNQQQSLFQRYIEDSAGIGFGEEMKHSAKTAHIMRRLVNFVNWPSEAHPFEANCNKSTVSVLQSLEDQAAHDAKKEPRTMTGASLVSIGSNQRMFLWNSPFHRICVNLFINRELQSTDLDKQIEPKLLQKLADNKYYILKVIETWPLAQQARALEQILNERTPLGQVAKTQRSNTWRLPDETRGLLQAAAAQLAKVEKILSSKEQEEDWLNVARP